MQYVFYYIFLNTMVGMLSLSSPSYQTLAYDTVLLSIGTMC